MQMRLNRVRFNKAAKKNKNSFCQFIIHKVKEAGPPNFINDA